MRGARNPMNSWARMDSSYDEDGNFVFGPNDIDLAKRLRMAGSDHRKFIRQIPQNSSKIRYNVVRTSLVGYERLWFATS